MSSLDGEPLPKSLPKEECYGAIDTYESASTQLRTEKVNYSSSISPSSLPECTAGSSFGGIRAGGVLVRRRSRGGPGDRSRGLGSLLVLCFFC